MPWGREGGREESKVLVVVTDLGLFVCVVYEFGVFVGSIVFVCRWWDYLCYFLVGVSCYAGVVMKYSYQG